MAWSAGAEAEPVAVTMMPGPCAAGITSRVGEAGAETVRAEAMPAPMPASDTSARRRSSVGGMVAGSWSLHSDWDLPTWEVRKQKRRTDDMCFQRADKRQVMR